MKKFVILMVLLFSVYPIFADKPVAVDMKDTVLSRGYPNVVEVRDKYYVLDSSQRKIFVFNRKKYLFSFAQAGQGPGDLENPVAMATDGKDIYVMDSHTGKISIFSNKGKFLRTFKLKESSNEALVLLCGLGVYGDKLVVTLSRGKDFLRIYDREGKRLHIITKQDDHFKELGHDFDVDIDGARHRAYIMSRFTGETYVVALDTRKILYKLEIDEPQVRELTQSIIQKDRQSKFQGDFISVSIPVGFFPLVRDGHKLTVICSSNKVKKDGGFLCHTFTRGITPERSYVQLGLEDVLCIKRCADRYLLFDREGQIYIKRSL